MSEDDKKTYKEDAAESMRYFLTFLSSKSKSYWEHGVVASPVGSIVNVVGPLVKGGLKHIIMPMRVVKKDRDGVTLEPDLH